MRQETLNGRTTVAASKVIRIDQEVWFELQQRAIPFQDNPNSVLRRLLELTTIRARDSIDSGTDLPFTRVGKLLQLVKPQTGKLLAISPTKTGQCYRFKSRRDKVVAFIHSQVRRLKVESSEQMANDAGINNWDHWLSNGWWRQDHSVYWYIPNDDEGAYARVAGVLGRLWRI